MRASIRVASAAWLASLLSFMACHKADVTTATSSAATGLAKVMCLAEAFKATLTAAQVATVQLSYSKADAVKWSPHSVWRDRTGDYGGN